MMHSMKQDVVQVMLLIRVEGARMKPYWPY